MDFFSGIIATLRSCFQHACFSHIFVYFLNADDTDDTDPHRCIKFMALNRINPCHRCHPRSPQVVHRRHRLMRSNSKSESRTNDTIFRNFSHSRPCSLFPGDGLMGYQPNHERCRHCRYLLGYRIRNYERHLLFSDSGRI